MRNTTGTLLCNHGSFHMDRRPLKAIDQARKFECRTVRHQRITMKECLTQISINGVGIPVPVATMGGVHFGLV